MNQHDEDIARLFARVESPPVSEAFTAQVRQRVARARLWAKLLTVGGFALALIVILATLRVPFDVLYPVARLQGLLTSFTGMIVCAIGALIIAAWQRSTDT